MVETDIGYALIVFALLNLLDWITTHYGLTKLGMRELNPIARKIYERFGSPGLYTWKQIGVGFIVITLYLTMGADAETVLWVYNALFALVVLWNSAQIARRLWELRRA
jgi:hypothetical protein